MHLRDSSRDQDPVAAGNPRNVHIPRSERDTAGQVAQKNNHAPVGFFLMMKKAMTVCHICF